MGSQWDVPFWFTLQPLVGQPHVQALCQAPDTHRDAQKTKGSNFPGDPAIRIPGFHCCGPGRGEQRLVTQQISKDERLFMTPT